MPRERVSLDTPLHWVAGCVAHIYIFFKWMKSVFKGKSIISFFRVEEKRSDAQRKKAYLSFKKKKTAQDRRYRNTLSLLPPLPGDAPDNSNCHAILTAQTNRHSYLAAFSCVNKQTRIDLTLACWCVFFHCLY
jgi:hypothetical protein